MKFKDLLKKLKASQQYDSFASAYKDAFIVAGFFVLDNETKKNIYQIDYFIPSKNKIAAFALEDQVSMQMLDSKSDAPQLKELDSNAAIDLDAIEGILDDEMKNRGISESIKKIVAVLHTNDENKRLWNLNCMLSGMTLLRAHVDDDSQTVLKMEKVSLFDAIKTVPGLKGKNPTQVKPVSVQSLNPAKKKEAIKTELDKLNKLESAIENEKSLLKKELDKDKDSVKKKK